MSVRVSDKASRFVLLSCSTISHIFDVIALNGKRDVNNSKTIGFREPRAKKKIKLKRVTRGNCKLKIKIYNAQEDRSQDVRFSLVTVYSASESYCVHLGFIYENQPTTERERNVHVSSTVSNVCPLSRYLILII